MKWTTVLIAAGGFAAALCGLAGVRAARRDGVGQLIDVSLHEGSRHAAQSALILAFSNIDMLAALHGGNAAGTAPSNQLVMDYMIKFMRYTKEQASFLRERGCDELQGELYSRPLTVEEFTRFLESRRAASRSA